MMIKRVTMLLTLLALLVVPAIGMMPIPQSQLGDHAAYALFVFIIEDPDPIPQIVGPPEPVPSVQYQTLDNPIADVFGHDRQGPLDDVVFDEATMWPLAVTTQANGSSQNIGFHGWDGVGWAPADGTTCTEPHCGHFACLPEMAAPTFNPLPHC